MNSSTGMVTFLGCEFAEHDQGWIAHPQAMPNLLEQYDRLVRRVLVSGGRIFRHTPETHMVAFTAPQAALETALALLRAVAQEGEFAVRIALHTGVVQQQQGEYLGQAVIHASALVRLAHPGQLLLSRLTAELLEPVSSSCTLRNLGQYRLRSGLHETIMQVVVPDLVVDFPPLLAETSHTVRLPVPSTPLIGREQELALIEDRLGHGESRLLSLVGPGGVGKTRLALAAASQLAYKRQLATYFVPLAALLQPEEVMPTLARTLQLVLSPTSAATNLVMDYVRDRQLLLVLDNVEQIVEAAPLFAELLSGAPQLLLLITSRVPLRLSAEYELVVKPFDLPDLRSLPDEIVHNDAVRLLIERTQAQGSPLIINTQNVQAVAALCTALDGLPLALELAAARLKVLPPAALLARIDNRLNLLTSRFRDVPERQRTLRDTLAWSYNLLDPPAQQLFRQMGCFRGGCTLEALEYLFLDREHYSAELFDHLSTLIDASLVQQETLSDGPEVRYTMLETVRVFAVELLEDDPAAQVIHERHAAYFVHFAQRAERGMRGQKQQQYLELLERDRDNFQAALEWSLKSGATATTLELGAALGPFWLMRGYSEEGYNWLHLALAQNPSVVSLQRIRALIVAGELASGRNDASAAEQAFHQARQGSLALGLLLEEAQAFNGLGNLYRVKGEYEQAREYLNEALTRLRTLDDRWIISTTLLNLGLIAMRQGENEQAQSYFSESQTLCQANGNSYGLIRALANLASLATYRGDYPTAQRTFTECLALCRVLGDRPGINRALISLGALASYQNEQHGAQRYFAESLQLCRELGDRQGSAMALLNLGNVAERIGNFAAARGYLEESLLLGRALGERQIIATSLANLGSALLGLQELSGALAHFQQALREFVPMNDQRGIALTVEMIACILARQGNAGQAIRLFGGANALRTRIGVPWSPTETASREPFLAQARQMIPPAAFERAWAEGQSLMATELIATALLPDDSVLTRATVNPEPQTIQPDRLTEREIEVLRLLADGLEDAQIATILHVSPRTIHSHLRSIYGKLGVANRTSAVRIAHEQGIL